jgi:hypothetical protein
MLENPSEVGASRPRFLVLKSVRPSRLSFVEARGDDPCRERDAAR